MIAISEQVKLPNDDKKYSYISIYSLDERKIIKNIKIGEEANYVRALVFRNDDNYLLYRTWENNETKFYDIKNDKLLPCNILIGHPIYADDQTIVNIYIQCYNFNWTVVGVNETPDTNPILYPNPTTNTINLNIDEKYFNGNWQLTDITGQILLKGEISNNENFQIDISNLTPATYFLRISNGKEFKVENVVKW